MNKKLMIGLATLLGYTSIYAQNLDQKMQQFISGMQAKNVVMKGPSVNDQTWNVGFYVNNKLVQPKSDVGAQEQDNKSVWNTPLLTWHVYKGHSQRNDSLVNLINSSPSHYAQVLSDTTNVDSLIAKIYGKMHNNPTSVSTSNTTPLKFELYQNYPNPFNPNTTITFDLPVSSEVILSIVDVLGNVVSKDRINGVNGKNTYSFDGSKLSSGTYFYNIDIGNRSRTKKMVLLR